MTVVGPNWLQSLVRCARRHSPDHAGNRGRDVHSGRASQLAGGSGASRSIPAIHAPHATVNVDIRLRAREGSTCVLAPRYQAQGVGSAREKGSRGTGVPSGLPGRTRGRVTRPRRSVTLSGHSCHDVRPLVTGVSGSCHSPTQAEPWRNCVTPDVIRVTISITGS